MNKKNCASLLVIGSWLLSLATASAYSVTATSITFDYSDQSPSSASANAGYLDTFIQSIANDTSSTTKTIYFADSGTYSFELGSSGQMTAFQNVQNLVISGTTDVTISWHCSSTPHSFFLFDGNCWNVEIKDLTFTTTFPAASQGDGCHLKIAGTGFSVHDNTFTASPGFVVQFIHLNGLDPSNDHFDLNRIIDTYADGIHVSTGSDLWFVGNVIMHTGDDSIAVIWDPSDDATKPDDIHILANVIDSSTYRGIVIESADDVWIEDNVITGTASTGIEIDTILETSDNLGSGDFVYRANYVHINGNGIAGVGTIGAHAYFDDDGPGSNDDPILSYRSAIFCRNAVNISINLEDSWDYSRGLEPAYSLVGYPPYYSPAYFSTVSSHYSVEMMNTLYGVIDNLSNATAGATGVTNATTPVYPATSDGSGNEGLILHQYYGY